MRESLPGREADHGVRVEESGNKVSCLVVVQSAALPRRGGGGAGAAAILTRSRQTLSQPTVNPRGRLGLPLEESPRTAPKSWQNGPSSLYYYSLTLHSLKFRSILRTADRPSPVPTDSEAA